MAANPVPVDYDLPWDRLFGELRNLEQARRPRLVPEHQQEAPVEPSHLKGLPAILREAAAAIRSAEARAEMLEQQVAAVREASKADLLVAEAACKALERNAEDANETIRTLELRARTAEERIRLLEARLNSVRQVICGGAVTSDVLVQLRPNPTIKGQQPSFAAAGPI